jgi:sugar phosphate isomerase/epimerase
LGDNPAVRAPISIQLYTLREQAQADLGGVIARLGRIGYHGVEPAGLHGMDPVEFRKRVEDAGMRVSSAHIPFPDAEHAQEIFDAHQPLGCRDLVVAFLPEDRFADAEAVAETAKALNRAGQRARARGLRLGYHNHWWEFRRRIDGRSAHAALFEQLDPEIFAEVDLYWAKSGGADPTQTLRELRERARFVHVKDGPADDPAAPMTAVGEGTLDFHAALRANPRVEWHVVELDRCTTDMFEAVERSYRYLVSSGLSRGRI